MSTESQSRASLDTPSGGLITQFDLHLRIIADRYLNFFIERRRIEETYISSLWKLHNRTRAIDAYFDSLVEPNTMKVAWNEVRDNVERETEARRAYLRTLTTEVIHPLTALKETQDRTRKRIKDDLKASTLAHTEFAENTLPKFKRAYLKKCQDFEDHRLASTPPGVGQVFSVPEGSTVPGSRSNPNLPSKMQVASPQPLRPLDRKPSSGGPRNRSPSTSTALSDLAQQGKKQLNQLITLLDKEGGIRGSNRNADNALRSVRAKREADEADKDYRKAVHWLETLRIRRVKTLEGGYNSLERFVYDGTETIKKVLVTYVDTMIATFTTQSHHATSARAVVEKVSPETDTSLLAASLRRSLAVSIPPPTLYYNYHVGECQDLIFGVTLVDYATARGSENDLPKIVKICIEEVDRRGLDAEGIYRVSGRHANVQELQHKLERSEEAFSFNSYTDDIYSVASFLKLYLRELPEPLFKFPLQDRIQHSESKADHAANDFVVLRSKIRRLPSVHRVLLKALVEHLSRIASHADRNKMDGKNLAIVFGPVVFGEDEIPQGDLLNLQPAKDSVMEDLIENAQTLFDERVPPSSPPLPPTPGGEPVPVATYGSSHTMVTLPPPGEAQVADFTPQLPPRPANSIHPSARSNPPILQVAADPAEQLARGKVVTGRGSTEVADETLYDQSHLLISPLVESASEQRQQGVAVESVPNTPLTASSQTSSTSSGPC
ncbi:hypothetical protein EI94DRAFT_1776950 [Lactarius quietus]|nr:hypothetical protein EI94DRAFT_1776950 [Lactarius quietus]